MIDLSALKNKFAHVHVLGLGVSGRAVIDALRHSDIAFTAWDDRTETREVFERDGIVISDPAETATAQDLVIRSVGMPPHHPAINALTKRHVTLWNDLDLLFFANRQARYLGITGTNGKSTTTALIGHILRQNDVPVAIGGNIGLAAPTLPMLERDGIYVLELSSYQLATARLLRCDIAVLLNITEDHLDWHDTMDNYIADKALIFRLRDHHTQSAVIGIDTVPSHALSATLAQSPNHDVTLVTQQATRAEADSVALIDGTLFDHGVDIEWPSHPILRGRHNAENRLAAFAACRAAGLTPEQIFKAMDSFTGLRHRQQPVATRGNVTFINDSKATNADATATALAVFDNIYWIVGGKDKTDGIDGLDLYYPKIRRAYLIGAATERFAAQLDGRLAMSSCGTIAHAVRQAYADVKTQNGDAVILLSPACASFDQYANFEQRGDDFISQVEQLLQGNPA